MYLYPRQARDSFARVHLYIRLLPYVHRHLPFPLTLTLPYLTYSCASVEPTLFVLEAGDCVEARFKSQFNDTDRSRLSHTHLSPLRLVGSRIEYLYY